LLCTVHLKQGNVQECRTSNGRAPLHCTTPTWHTSRRSSQWRTPPACSLGLQPEPQASRWRGSCRNTRPRWTGGTGHAPPPGPPAGRKRPSDPLRLHPGRSATIKDIRIRDQKEATRMDRRGYRDGHCPTRAATSPCSPRRSAAPRTSSSRRRARRRPWPCRPSRRRRPGHSPVPRRPWSAYRHLQRNPRTVS